MQLAIMASGAVRQEKAIYEGNEEEGVMFAGQVIGAIDDLPTVKELVERTSAEAEEVLTRIGGKVAS
jgi:NAD(P)H-dependent flavin oxidoreductase YrpB (nitropropane dioxygenase family)